MDSVSFTSNDRMRLNVLIRKVKYNLYMSDNEVQEYIQLLRNRAVIRAQKSYQDKVIDYQSQYEATEKWHP